jgi:hypothetical protein
MLLEAWAKRDAEAFYRLIAVCRLQINYEAGSRNASSSPL